MGAFKHLQNKVYRYDRNNLISFIFYGVLRWGQTILILKPVVAALEEEAVGVLVAQVDAESDEDDADDGSQDAHHNDGSLTNKKSVNFC